MGNNFENIKDAMMHMLSQYWHGDDYLATGNLTDVVRPYNHVQVGIFGADEVSLKIERPRLIWYVNGVEMSVEEIQTRFTTKCEM